MHKSLMQSFVLPAIVTAILLPGSALAQNPPIGIRYSPLSAASTPTLSDLALILTAILLAAIAFRVIRKKGAGNPFGIVLALGALALGAGGINDLRQAYATSADPVEMTNPAGGEVSASPGDEVKNATGVTQQIVGIDCPIQAGGTTEQLAATNGDAPICNDNPGTILPAEQSCIVPDVCEPMN